MRGIGNCGAVRRIVLTFALSALIAACATFPNPRSNRLSRLLRRLSQLRRRRLSAWPGGTARVFTVTKMRPWNHDQEDMTAASIAFPLGSRVMVTNLDNGLSVEVTITDRGPFVKGRKIDLSHRAARMIGMLGPGTARVRIALISKPAGTRDVPARRCATGCRSVLFRSE